MATIVIKRAYSAKHHSVNYNVWLSDEYVGELYNGGTLEVSANVGIHRLSFAKMKRLPIYSEQDVFFDVVVNDDNETVELKCEFEQNAITVEYANNAPHIPTFIENAQYGSATYSEHSEDVSSHDKYPIYRRSTIVCRTCGAQISPRAKKCPHCGEKPLGVALGEGIGSLLIGIIMFPFIIIAILITVAFYYGLFH